MVGPATKAAMEDVEVIKRLTQVGRCQYCHGVHVHVFCWFQRFGEMGKAMSVETNVL